MQFNLRPLILRWSSSPVIELQQVEPSECQLIGFAGVYVNRLLDEERAQLPKSFEIFHELQIIDPDVIIDFELRILTEWFGITAAFQAGIIADFQVEILARRSEANEPGRLRAFILCHGYPSRETNRALGSACDVLSLGRGDAHILFPACCEYNFFTNAAAGLHSGPGSRFARHP